jgi:hypothetical protein
MRGIATLRIKQYADYRLPTINNSGESTKNHENLLEIEAVLERPSDAKLGAREEHIPEEIRSKKSRWTVPLRIVDFSIGTSKTGDESRMYVLLFSFYH